MSRFIRILAALSLAAMLAACAGTNFKRPEAGALALGTSTESDVRRVMGEPRTVGEGVQNEKRIKTLQYAYANTTGEPMYPGVIPTRSMAFMTHEGVLVGQQFISSFRNDTTDFDDSKVSAITKGRTTRAEVLQLLGQPTGEAIFPVARVQGGKAVLYSYAQAKGNAFNMKFHRKMLVVSFDERGVVSDLEFSSSGDK